MPSPERIHVDERMCMEDDGKPPGGLRVDSYNQEPAPIVSVSVGSAGMRRNAVYRRKMDALNCVDRIQSLVAYDCNRTNVMQWTEAARSSGANARSVQPEYLPFAEGFLRDPNFFTAHYGPIERDMEQMIDRMEQLSNESGVRPQLIIEWIGFGGHARLSYLFHEMLVERFRSARILPVYCMPDDRVLEQNIRDYGLWSEAQSILGGIPSVITDNRSFHNLRHLDERVAMTLASIEACYKYRPEYGTMAETVATFGIHGSRWLGLEMCDIAYRDAGIVQRTREPEKDLRQRLPKRLRPKLPNKQETISERAAATMASQLVKEAIWRIAAPSNDEIHTAFMGNAPYDAEQKIYVILPFDVETTERIKNDVIDQLQRETFNGPYPGTKVCFASGNANYSNVPDGYVAGHVCKVYGIDTETPPPSVLRILEPKNDSRSRNRRVLSRGEEMMRDMCLSSNGTRSEDVGLSDRTNGAMPPDMGTGPGKLLDEVSEGVYQSEARNSA